MTNRWIERRIAEPTAVSRLQSDLNNLDPALARSLVVRGIDSLDKARRFFRPSIEYQHDPLLMADMKRAAERVAQAIRNHEKVMVYGDYDVDGTTSVALLMTFLRNRGVTTDYFVPHRVEHGYGLSEFGIDVAIEAGASLMIALDCGVTAIEAAFYAKQQGLDLIICDHHTPKDELPEAVAVLDPKRPDCEYPYNELSGCGIGYKLVCATLRELDDSEAVAAELLDFVALSIASDIVPLDGENRILMQEGLQRLRRSPRLGIRALAAAAALDLTACTTRDIVFCLGPRINAAGRLGDAGRAVDLLLAHREEEAYTLSKTLEETNDRRRDIDRETADAAVEIARATFGDRPGAAIVLHNSDWHPGVVGIVASRVVERFARPSILLTTIDGIAKGSARSVPGINVFDAIKECAKHLIEFGGHDFAAGLSLLPANIPAFAEQFRDAVQAQATEDTFVSSIGYDASLMLDAVNSRFWAVLRQFAPHGPSNEQPVFRSESLQVIGRPRTVGTGGRHLKFVVRQEGTRPMEVIGFGLGDHLEMLSESRREGKPIEMLFSIDEQVWKGRRSLQLQARDVRMETSVGVQNHRAELVDSSAI